LVNFTTHAQPGAFFSRFGGTWTDLSNAMEILDGRFNLGTISKQEANLVEGWIKMASSFWRIP